MDTVRTIDIDGATWSVEDGAERQPGRGRTYRLIKFTRGARVRYGQIATPKALSQLSNEALELVFVLAQDAPSGPG